MATRNVKKSPGAAGKPAGALALFGLLRRNAGLRRLVVSVLLMEVGQWATWVAVPLFVIERHGLGLDVGLTTGLMAVPNILLGIAAGNIVDRSNPRNVLVVSAVFSGAMVALFPLTTALWQVQILAVLVGIGYMFVVPAALALRPQVMDAGSEMSGNGLVVTAQRMARFIGPAVAGPAIALVGLSWVFVLEGAMALIATLFFARISSHVPVERAPKNRAAGIAAALRPANWAGELVGDVRSVAGFLRSSPRLGALTITVLTYYLAFGAGTILLAAHSLKDFSDMPGMLGYMFGALGVGGIVGATLAPMLSRYPSGVVYVLASVLEGVAWLVLPWTDSAIVAVLLMLIAGALESSATVIFFTQVQHLLPAEYTGRYYATVLSVGDAFQLGGRSLGGLLTPAIGVPWAAAAIFAVFALPAVVLAAPLVREGPRPSPTTEHVQEKPKPSHQ
ncbi:MFS transporter [Streptomyces purpurogeneiscleroticus]|uniref:MFS transporter n=1 Tax=Streptomyces purpurogeneiscleroticus TaxID=68259 RepID=UPI001CC1C10A|nr:MFS transporter [Streptomyces purpurogeneiscleroticus]